MVWISSFQENSWTFREQFEDVVTDLARCYGVNKLLKTVPRDKRVLPVYAKGIFSCRFCGHKWASEFAWVKVDISERRVKAFYQQKCTFCFDSAGSAVAPHFTEVELRRLACQALFATGLLGEPSAHMKKFLEDGSTGGQARARARSGSIRRKPHRSILCEKCGFDDLSVPACVGDNVREKHRRMSSTSKDPFEWDDGNLVREMFTFLGIDEGGKDHSRLSSSVGVVARKEKEVDNVKLEKRRMSRKRKWHRRGDIDEYFEYFGAKKVKREVKPEGGVRADLREKLRRRLRSIAFKRPSLTITKYRDSRRTVDSKPSLISISSSDDEDYRSGKPRKDTSSRSVIWFCDIVSLDL